MSCHGREVGRDRLEQRAAVERQGEEPRRARQLGQRRLLDELLVVLAVEVGVTTGRAGSRGRARRSAPACPFMCFGPLWKRQPFHCRQRCCVVYGQSNRFERMFSGTFTVIPPTASISFSNWLKSTITTWLTGSARAEEPVDRLDRELRPAELHRRVDLLLAVPGHVTSAGRAGSRGSTRRWWPGSVWRSVIESECWSTLRPAPAFPVAWSVPSSRIVVGLREEEAAVRRERPARTFCGRRLFASLTPLATER